MQKVVVKPKKHEITKQSYELKPVVIKKNNLRYIEPYEFKYQLYVKRRWVGKKLIEVLVSEFRRYSESYFLEAMEKGLLKLNGVQALPNTILKDNDFIAHVVTRHENPIWDAKLNIVYEDEEYLVVDKPPSWPIHVCGGYQFNTLNRILIDDYGYKNLKMLHRLDKHTSGIVITAKTKEAADEFRKLLHSDFVQKTYLCRVKGDFPEGTCKVDRAIISVNKAKGILTDCDDDGYYVKLEEDEIEKMKFFDEEKEGEGNENGIEQNETKEELLSKEKNQPVLAEAVPESKEILEEKNLETKKKQVIDIYEESKESSKDKQSKVKTKDNKILELEEVNKPKSAITFFEKIFYDPESNTSVIFAKPKTGRTHQIRIHLRYLKFPIANDPCYGGIVYNDIKELQGVEKDEEKEDFEIRDNKSKNITVSDMFCYRIWLHALNYKFVDKEFKTNYPEWAKKEFKLNKKFVD